MADSASHVIPSASRLMASLRDIGYDLPTAVADLIDNSIDADAGRVEVTFAPAGAQSWIRIVDDGFGMTARELTEAMRYGSQRTYEGGALGRFGLGLKTASLSQCRRLTVATRTTPGGRIEIRRWDLDDVARHDTWRLARLTPSECAPHVTQPLMGRSGTVVLWERLDRVLGYRRPDGAAAMAALDAARTQTAEHIAMIFHRFLSGDLRARRRRIRITLDEEPVIAWDPYARGESATQRLSRQTVRFEHDGVTHRVTVRPYVLPAQIQFSSPDAHARAAGPARWNRQQGLYIYRGDRLVQSGGWNRLRTMDEHSKLARIAVDIPPGTESLFGINVAKMRVALPAEVRPALAAIVSGVVARAQETYRQRVRLVHGDLPAAGGHSSPEHARPGSGWRMADHWPIIVAVLERELAGQPEVLRRALVALANATPADLDDPGATGPASAISAAQ